VVLALTVAGLVVVALVVVAIAAGGGEAPPRPPQATARHPEPTPADEEVDRALGEMSTEEKVAQLMLVGFEGPGGGDVLEGLRQRDYAGLVIDARNDVSSSQVEELADEAARAARRADHTPPWVMAVQDGGELNAIPDAPPEEPPSELGEPEEAADEVGEAGEELLDLGVNGLLGPALDVGVEDPLGVGVDTEQAYSDLPGEVTEYATAAVEALSDAGIFAAAKHFPGLGGASQPAEQGPASVGLTLEELAARDLRPFRAAIDAGVPGIVIGPGLYGFDDFVTPALASESIVTGLLRDDLGYRGLAIADDVTSPAVTSTFPAPDAAVAAVNAGADLAYVSRREDERREVYEALLQAAEDGDIPEARVDEAVRRNLVAKQEAGLLRDGDEDRRGRERSGDGGSDRDRDRARRSGDGGSERGGRSGDRERR